MKIVKSLEEYVLLIKGVSETIKIEAKGQRGGFFSMLLGTLDDSLSENLLEGKRVRRASKGTTTAGQKF